MGLLDNIEKLITEHGSAAVLRERIALANDKHAAVERRAADLQAQLQQAEEANRRLRAENEQLKKPAELIAAEPASPAETLVHDAVKDEILVLLATQDGASDQQVAQAIGVSAQLAHFYLQELEAVHCAMRRTLRVGQRVTRWSISEEGCRYLISRELLK